MNSTLSQELDFLGILTCPISQNDLLELSASEVEDLNALIQQKMLFNYEGSAIAEPLERGLVSSCGRYFYRIQEGVIILLKNLAMVKEEDLDQSDSKEGLMKDKKAVQDFYNQFGWKKTEAGVFNDGDEFEDLRPVSQQYMYDCNMRVKRYLRPKGTYLLDAASGPIQFDEYLEYSKDYKYRICVDLSFLALRQAREKLGDRGIYLVADMTNLPIKDNTIDAVVSLNTVYHITRDEQAQAIQHMHRVLKPGAGGIVVYSWGRRSYLNNLLALPHKVAIKLKALYLDKVKTDREIPALYFHAHKRDYFFDEDRMGFQMELKVWRLLSVPTMKYYVHSWLGGKALLRAIYRLEDRAPQWCGRVGEYPMFFFKKEEKAAAPKAEQVAAHGVI